MITRRELPESPYLVAATGRKPSRVPVWFMRQAGRSLPEYRALREQHSMLAACLEPEVACEITLQPIRRYDVDAAILFSDIVVPQQENPLTDAQLYALNDQFCSKIGVEVQHGG